MKKIFIFFLIPLLSFSSVLEDRINEKAKSLCAYIADDGTTANDYSPTISNQTYRSHFQDNGDTCDNWTTDPYVNIDIELNKVVADMTCTYSSDNDVTTLMQYNLDVECNIGCLIPRDSNGNKYIFNQDFGEASCNVTDIQNYLKLLDENTSTIVDDSKFLSCDDSTKAGCYYHTHINIENNYDMNVTNTLITSTNNKLDTLNSNSVAIGNQLEQIFHQQQATTSAIEENTRSLGSKLDRLRGIETSLEHIDDFMQSENSNTEAGDSMSDAISQSQKTVTSITSSLNEIIENYTGTAPIVTGNGKHVFTANVYNRSVSFDLSMFERLRPEFDILWLLLLAYLNFKIYSVIIIDLLKKI